MNNDQDIQERIAQLEHDAQNRITQLEAETQALKSKGKSQTLRHRFVLGLAVVAMGLSLMAQKADTQTTEYETIICKQIKVIGEDRSVLAMVGSDAEGSGGLVSVYNYAQKRVVALAQNKETGEGLATFSDEAGTYGAGIGVSGGTGYVYTKK